MAQLLYFFDLVLRQRSEVMATAGSPQASIRATSSTDPVWKYCHSIKENDTHNVVCNFCGEITNGGYIGVKQHLMVKKGNLAACQHCPTEVREELWAYFRGKMKPESAEMEIEDVSALDLEILGFGESEEEEEGLRDDISIALERKKKTTMKGSLDLYHQNPETAVERRKMVKMRQTSIRKACDKEARARVNQYVARWIYQAGIPLNAVNLESFHHMIEAIGSYGPNLNPITFHEIRVTHLNKELEYTENLFKGHKEQWAKHGCSIMLHAWTDRKQRSLINVLVNSLAGTMFVKTIDASEFVKTSEKLFELLDSLVEEIGEEKVVQVITDNESNYVLAGKKLEEKRKHLYWTPCAAHCIDLMIEDISRLPLVKKTIQRATTLVGFIYSNSSTLNMLRHFTNKRELVRHAVTRFATSFHSLEMIYKEKANLIRMFTSDDWMKNKLAKDAKGKKATEVVLKPSFWSHVVYTLKIMAPLVQVLRLVDGEKKSTMGYIYEAMNKAKEAIMKSFKNIESKCKDVFAIIDDRWTYQLHRPLHAAGHFLNPEFYYSNPQLEFDLEVIIGLYDCFRRLVPSREVQKNIQLELPIYKFARNLFGTEFAISQRKTLAPAQWWCMYGQSTPNLQQLAIKILNLTCSASGYERNWSVFEQIHSKKRNKLEHQRLHNLVYVKYNQTLKQRYNHRDVIDPISLSNIDNCNEWLVGEMDDDNGAENELVFEGDDTLNWGAVYRASGAIQIRTYTRQQTKKRKATSSATSIAARVGKKGSATPSSSSRGKAKVIEDEEELEFEDNPEESKEELEETNFEESEGEEEEGYASLDDANENENDDYIEEEED